LIQENTDKKGYVYILVNPAFPGFLKVGKTTKDPEARARELSSGSGVPAPFAVAWDAFVNDCDHVEKLIHQQLAHTRSRRDREFFAIPLKHAISVISNIIDPFSCELNTLSNISLTTNIDSSPIEPMTVTMSDSSIEVPAIPFYKASEYSNAEIDDLRCAVLTFYKVVMPRKIRREADAGEILRQFRGKYTVEILDKVFDLVDKDPSGPWFGQMLSRPNRNMLYRCPITELNILIDNLLKGDLGNLGLWRRAGNRGMKPGTATLLMYLHSPESFNIWQSKSHSGLSRLSDFEAETPKKEMSPEQYSQSYERFNTTALTVRKESGFAPQAMDWLLWAVEEIKENPENRYLRAYIEGRTK